MRSEALHQIPVCVEDIDEPVPGAAYVIVVDSVLQGKADIEIAPNVLNPEGSETLSSKRTIACQHLVGERLDQSESGIEHLNGSEAEIGGKQEVA